MEMVEVVRNMQVGFQKAAMGEMVRSRRINGG